MPGINLKGIKMTESSYYFDPCSLDGSDKEEEETIDSWKPKKRAQIIPQS